MEIWQLLAATSYNREAKSCRTDWRPLRWSSIFLIFFSNRRISYHPLTCSQLSATGQSPKLITLSRASKVSVILFSSSGSHRAWRTSRARARACAWVTCEAHHIPPAVLAPCRCVFLVKERHISEGRISIPYILLSVTAGLVWLRHAGQRSRSKPCIQNRYWQQWCFDNVSNRNVN
jgi:hypothetical protein